MCTYLIDKGDSTVVVILKRRICAAFSGYRFAGKTMQKSEVCSSLGIHLACMLSQPLQCYQACDYDCSTGESLQQRGRHQLLASHANASVHSLPPVCIPQAAILA